MNIKPQVPDSVPIQKALAGSEPLQRLRQRLTESRARFEALRGCLPPNLLPHVQPGPLDETNWTLLASNQAIAVKLRHWQPLIEKTLQDGGWPAIGLRIRVNPGF
ncbi:MAG: hypothetical protein ACK53K_01595 [Burkholderiales bacterium]